MRIFCAALALSLTSLAATAGAQNPAETLPKLISHADAVYPQIARTAHVSGDVVVRITTDGQSVVEAVAESGPPLLRRASEDNARTWKFAPHSPGTFHVTFSYKISADDVATAASFSNTGGAEIQVATVPQPIIIDWAWVGLGKWKAKLRSQHGSLFETFRFSFSGPNGEWLDVATGDSPSENEDNNDDEFSRKDGDFLIFSMKLLEPDGKRLETYLVGRMSGNKLVGTFVDESGVRGTWTATRIPESEKK